MKKLALFPVLILLIAVTSAESWTGADEKAEEAVREIRPNFEPWLSPLWEPPSGEIESLLFSLQAAAGALVIGYVLGYYRGRNARNS